MLISGSLHRKWLLTAHTSNRMAWMSFLSWTYTSFTFTIAIWILILYINYGYTSYVYVLHKPLCIKKKKVIEIIVSQLQYWYFFFKLQLSLPIGCWVCNTSWHHFREIAQLPEILHAQLSLWNCIFLMKSSLILTYPQGN